MIITEPNKFVAEVHDRMPARVAEKDYEPRLCLKADIRLQRNNGRFGPFASFCTAKKHARLFADHHFLTSLWTRLIALT